MDTQQVLQVVSFVRLHRDTDFHNCNLLESLAGFDIVGDLTDCDDTDETAFAEVETVADLQKVEDIFWDIAGAIELLELVWLEVSG